MPDGMTGDRLMSEKKINCQFCKSYLFEDDDVVVCPVCGAPYHRDCYNKAGKCVYSEVHGTDEQYCAQPQEETPTEMELTCKTQTRINPWQSNYGDSHEVCQGCGRTFNDDEKFCPNCRAPRGFTPSAGFEIDTFGGINPDTVEDGVSAIQVRAFSLVNTRRYVPKYFALGKDKKVSWNWAAFLVPEGWFFYRKMYKAGIVAMLLMILAAVCAIPLNAVIEIPDSSTISSYYQVWQLFMKSFNKAGSFALIMAAASIAVNLAVRVFSGLFGDYIYKKFSKENILNLQEPTDDDVPDLPPEARLGRIGGVQPLMFVLGFWLVQFIPGIIQSLIL